MASRTWKCVPCGKAFQSSQPRTIGPNCPACGKSLVPVGTIAPRLPTPQPRIVAQHEPPVTHAPRSRSAGRTATASRLATAVRPTDPVEALAGMTASSPWSPEPDYGPSSVAVDVSTPEPYRGRESGTPAVANRRGRPAWMASPWTWASVGGVVVALAFSVAVIANRPRPSRAVAKAAKGADKPAVESPAAPVPAAPANAGATVEARAIDLFPYIDLARDAVSGKWRMDGGTLVCDASHRARVGIRYQVPREYDFRVQFTQVDGNNCAAQIFSAGNPGVLVMGAFKRSITGFQQLAGRWVDNKDNPTGVRGLRWENGRTHTSVVRVRKGSIEAWLDGKMITSYATDGSDLSNKDWAIPGFALGVGSEVSSTIFHKLELIDVSDTAQASR